MTKPVSFTGIRAVDLANLQQLLTTPTAEEPTKASPSKKKTKTATQETAQTPPAPLTKEQLAHVLSTIQKTQPKAHIPSGFIWGNVKFLIKSATLLTICSVVDALLFRSEGLRWTKNQVTDLYERSFYNSDVASIRNQVLNMLPDTLSAYFRSFGQNRSRNPTSNQGPGPTT